MSTRRRGTSGCAFIAHAYLHRALPMANWDSCAQTHHQILECDAEEDPNHVPASVAAFWREKSWIGPGYREKDSKVMAHSTGSEVYLQLQADSKEASGRSCGACTRSRL